MRRAVAVHRALLALGAAATVLFAGPVVAGPALDRATGFVAVGHSNLVSSSPGAGDVLTAPPTEIRLVFSEPIDPGYTSLDLLDGTGKAILVGAGTADPADPRTLVAPIPAGSPLASDSLYTVNWRALSAADGHTTDGFLTFGIGNVALDPSGHGAAGTVSSGTLHGGHAGGAVAAEIQGKVMGYGGSMLAFGLAILAWLVLRPALGRIPRGVAYGAGIALVVSAAGCILLLVVGADSLPSAAGIGTDYLRFATDSRVGQLLVARTVVGLVGGIVVLLVARFATGRGTAVAVALGGALGLVGLVLTAEGGHASAFASPVPVLMDVVHLAAASIWLGGLVMLGALTDFGGGSRLEPGALQRVIPRFSALALVSVTLIALTGIYADWVQTRDLLGFDSPYGLNLLIKILVFVLALAVGALNYFDGGREIGRRFSLSRRLLVELVLGVAVLAITANLTSGSPTGGDRPIAIQPARELGRLGRAGDTGAAAGSVRPEPVPGRPPDGPGRRDGGRARPPAARRRSRVVAHDDAAGCHESDPDLRHRRLAPDRESLGRDGRRDRGRWHRDRPPAVRLRPRRRRGHRGAGHATDRSGGGGRAPADGPRARRAGLRARWRDAAAHPAGRIAAGAHRGERGRAGPGLGAIIIGGPR